MRINKSNATFSSIVGIGQKIKKIELNTLNKFLHLNRGVNDVLGINLNEIMPMIPHNTKLFQVYAPNEGIVYAACEGVPVAFGEIIEGALAPSRVFNLPF